MRCDESGRIERRWNENRNLGNGGMGIDHLRW